ARAKALVRPAGLPAYEHCRRRGGVGEGSWAVHLRQRRRWTV
ncbi:MAG: hypothetical protein AVDCRST_MAG68-559, partial [uncultured Gemmatimonadetes bacterium]